MLHNPYLCFRSSLKTENLLAEPQEFSNDTLANDDAQHKAHKTNSTNFKYFKSEPPDTATLNPFRPAKNAEPIIKKKQMELFEVLTI